MKKLYAAAIFYCFSFFFILPDVFAQYDETTTPAVFGTPSVAHYNRHDFNADPQMWAMCQDRTGILYFGSNNGTLIYDGEKWQLVPLPNNSSVRSLFASDDGVVHVGGFNEFGIIRKDEYGKYYYESQVQLLRDEERNFENIWSIVGAEGQIVFRSNKFLIAVSGNKAVTLRVSSGNFEYSAVVNDMLFAYDGSGLLQVDLKSQDAKLVLPRTALANQSFLCVVPGARNALLVVTRQGSVFAFDIGNANVGLIRQIPGFTASNRITSVLRSASGYYYLGTLTTKVVAMSTLEDFVTPESFNDLQDNTVHALFETRDGNIWALLNNGIDCINVSSPVTKLFDKASISDVLLSGDRMFLATNQGVLAGPIQQGVPVSKGNFSNVDGLEGQAWSLHEIDGSLLCGHDMGVIVLGKNGYTRLPGPRGVWKIVPIRERKNEYLVCTYEGIHLMRSDGYGKFEIIRKIEGFEESSRDILESDEPGVFWLCHGYKGVFRIKIDDNYTRVTGLEYFTDKNGLPSQFNINVFRWQKEIVFTTNHGIFTYHAGQNRFTPHPFLTGLFGNDKNVRQLLQDGDKTWFVHHDEVGYFMTTSSQPELVKGLFLHVKGILNQSMECIKPVNPDNVIIGTREGLYSFDLKYRPKDDYTTLITAVKYSDGEREVSGLLTGGNVTQDIPYKTAILRFEFAVPGFDDHVNTQYSYKVDGISDSWSDWQSTAFKEYNLLPPGRYTFRVKAKSLLGETAGEASFAFRVAPVWYQTTVAFMAYIATASALILFLIKGIQKRIDTVRRKTRAEEADKRKVLELEIEHIKLEREKAEISKDKAILEEDLIMKSKELANYTMLLVKKRELLISMQEKLNDLRHNVRNDQAKMSVNELQKMISFNLQSEEHLKVFAANFERVHSEFFRQLKKAFPDLTNKELQLCAFIKMNLTNKEIASILNLSVRGVESQRYRLRKRLAMTQDEDMAAFLEKIYASSEAQY